MKELEYPFDSGYIMKKKRGIRKRLIEENAGRDMLKKRIAVLGGSTTADIVSVLGLFLLNYGIEAEFYESEYGQFWQDGVFGNEELDSFKPDLVYIHTSTRNLNFKPCPGMSGEETEEGLRSELSRFGKLWDSLRERFGCPVIQNNFEQPFFRLMGNSDGSANGGLVNFVNRLNVLFADEIERREGIYLNDINYLSAMYGVEKWSTPEYWYLYKYALCTDAIPALCFNIASIIKAIFGRNRKCLALDLDNTLWGGIVGDDGVDNLVIGQETAEAMAFSEWQQYVRSLKDIGVILAVVSKNEEENALAGLRHPEGSLRPEDMAVIKANWLPKSENIIQAAEDIGLLPEAFVLADDNPAERDIVRANAMGAAAPDIGQVTDYIRVIDRSGYFETVSLSQDDMKRAEMYRANALRKTDEQHFSDYGEYLDSLEMQAEILPFAPVYYQRLSQLANKSNQFNLTTKRCTPDEIKHFAEDEGYITLYGKLSDKYGDNGVVAEVIGRIEGSALHIQLWLMSCRVLKRGMEHTMLDELVKMCRERGLERIIGYYYPTPKNKMVAGLYKEFGFGQLAGDESGTVWSMELDSYKGCDSHISVNGGN
ncbi:MAG: HAD-IIIC family phosphatase [Ruminococcus sp.]|nr:HAD-IIIC family phosphatase [Ruminococcus sp.]